MMSRVCHDFNYSVKNWSHDSTIVILSEHIFPIVPTTITINGL